MRRCLCHWHRSSRASRRRCCRCPCRRAAATRARWAPAARASRWRSHAAYIAFTRDDERVGTSYMVSRRESGWADRTIIRAAPRARTCSADTDARAQRTASGSRYGSVTKSSAMLISRHHDRSAEERACVSALAPADALALAAAPLATCEKPKRLSAKKAAACRKEKSTDSQRLEPSPPPPPPPPPPPSPPLLLPPEPDPESSLYAFSSRISASAPPALRETVSTNDAL